MLSVRNLSSPNGAQVARLDIRAGEIVGFAGLVGAGRSEIARAIIGADPATGQVEVAGRRLPPHNIRAATEAGLVLVPEDRRGQGLVMTLPVRANISLPHLTHMSKAGILAEAEERGLAQRLIDRFQIRPSLVDGDISNYSGGNQQKVLIGKWIAGNPKVIILDEPSRGVDVGAREAIHNEIGRLAREGAAILIISSEIDEVLGLATRVHLVDRGQLVDEIDPDVVSEADVLAALFTHQGTEDDVA
nr:MULTISPECIES: ATP-binding cassette domain-containing protein [unclassified Roseobacter]